jgi:hypothetical protein
VLFTSEAEGAGAHIAIAESAAHVALTVPGLRRLGAEVSVRGGLDNGMTGRPTVPRAARKAG